MTTQEKAKLLIAIKQNPHLAIFRTLEEMEKRHTDHMKDMTSYMDDMEKRYENKIEKMIVSMSEQVLDGVMAQMSKKPMEEMMRHIEKLKGEKGDIGEDGVTPKKGVDYFTEKEKKEMVSEIFNKIRIPKDGKDGIVPKAGVDYPTKKELMAFIKKYIDNIEIPLAKDGYTPKKGVDYFTEKEIAKFVGEINILLDNKLTPELIKAKLKDLPIKDQWFSWYHIKDVPYEVRAKKDSGGGGGMGNWIHQSFSTDSSTTIITFSQNIAANGFALLAFYNGQYIFRGTHYTQSGRILTLLFNPQDGTNIDIAYVRGA